MKESTRRLGRKDRPCAIVAAIRVDDGGETRVLVLPVTHTPPENRNSPSKSRKP